MAFLNSLILFSSFLSPAFAVQSPSLETKLTAVMQAHPDVKALVQSSMSKLKSSSLTEFLKRIEACDGESAGRVHQQNEKLTLIIGREVEEPEYENQSELKAYYIKKAKSLPADFDPMNQTWLFEPDIISVTALKQTRKICLRVGMDTDTAVELLVHELVHFDHGTNSIEPADILKFKDAREYALQTVREAGDEVDAYAQGISLQIRLRGVGSLKQPGLQTFFDKYGVFIDSTRDRFAVFILDNMGYMKLRFESEYQTAIKNQLRIEGDRVEMAQSILKARKSLIAELQDFVKKRNRLFDAVNSKYAEESERTKKLLEKAQASEKRMKDELQYREPRVQQLKSKLNIL